MNGINSRSMVVRKEYIHAFRERVMWYWPHLLPEIQRPDVLLLQVTEKEYTSIIHFRNGFLSAINMFVRSEL